MTDHNEKRRAYYAANAALVGAQNKRWKDKNREHVRAQGRQYMQQRRESEPALREYARGYSKEYARKNPERVKANFKKFHTDNPDYNKDYLIRRARKNPAKYLWQHAKGRAARKDLPFTITPEDVVIPQICPVLGITLAIGIAGRGRANDAPSLDRIRPELGYVPGNVRVISMRANWLKGNGTISEFYKIIVYMQREGCT